VRYQVRAYVVRVSSPLDVPIAILTQHSFSTAAREADSSPQLPLRQQRRRRAFSNGSDANERVNKQVPVAAAVRHT
jgi:hypothetical protein